MGFYVEHAGETIPYIYTKRIYFDKGDYKIFVDSPSNSQLRIYSPSGHIKIGNDGILDISGQSAIRIYNTLQVKGRICSDKEICISSNANISGTIRLKKASIQLAIPTSDGLYSNSDGREGNMLTGTFKPSCATGYITIQIGNHVGIIPMYSQSRLL